MYKDFSPEKALRVMDVPGFQWHVGMLIENADGLVRVESVDSYGTPGILSECQWSGETLHCDIRCGPRVFYPDPQTATILDKVLPTWREVLDEP